MTERRLKVVLEAQVDRYKSAMSAAASSTEKLEKAAKDAGNTDAKRVKALRELETPLLAIGAASVAGLGLSAKAAMDWESAWAGVTKTVEASPKQFAEIEDGLRDMTRILPASHDEIAGVAAAAGQLGVKAGDIVGFTKTMIDLGESTNLTAEEAATSIAQISNVMGTMEREGAEGAARFGAALVDLGNNSATTEADILNMAQRIAGAGATVGATEGDVLALSATLASMGVKAELGGGVASRILLKLREGVDEGGESLAAFAETAGLSADEFSEAFREDPVQALGLVSQGIGKVNESGGNVTQTLKDMGITGSENVTTMLALANSGDLLNDSLERSAEAWSANTALVDEAEQRYATTESKIKIAWNTIKDAAITAGGAILPVVAGLAEGVAGLVGWFGDLPEPVQIAMGGLAGVAGVGAGALGLFIKLAPAVRDGVGAFRDLTGSLRRAEGPMTRTQTNLSKLGRGARIAAGGVAALGIIGPTIGSLVNSGNVAASEDMADALFRIGAGGQAANTGMGDLDEMFTGAGNWFDGLDVTGLERSLEIAGNPKLTDNIDQWTAKILTFGTRGSTNMEFVTKNFQELDSTLSSMASSGASEQAAEAYEQIAAAAEDAGVPTEKLVELFPQYADALGSAKVQSEAAAAGSEELDAALEGVGVSAEGVIEKMDTFLEQLFEAGLRTMSSRDAAGAYQEGLDGVDDAIKTITESNGKMGETLNKSKTDFDLTTESGRLANETFQGLARGGMAEVEALAAEGVGQDVLQEKLGQTYEDLITTGKQFGLTGGDAQDLARKILGVPDGVDIDSWMDDEAKRTAEATNAEVSRLDGRNATVTTTERHVRTFETHGVPFRPAPSTNIRSMLGAGFYDHKAKGGRLGSYSDGGRLPATGLGTDQILGTDANGTPTAWVDDREWVINRRSSDKYNRELAMINAGTFPKLPGLAGGGQAASVPQARDMVAPDVQVAPVVNFPDQIALKLGPNVPVVMAKLVAQGQHRRNRR